MLAVDGRRLKQYQMTVHGDSLAGESIYLGQRLSSTRLPYLTFPRARSAQVCPYGFRAESIGVVPSPSVEALADIPYATR